MIAPAVAPGPLTQSQVDDQATQLYFVATKSKRILLWVAVAAVVVLLGIVAFAINQQRTASQIASSAVDPAKVTEPHNGGSPSGSSQVAGGASAKDISAYVDFLQGIETRRAALRASLVDSTAKLIPPDTTAPPTPPPGTPPLPTPAPTAAPTGSAEAFTAYQQQWQDLVRDFNAQRAPQGCETLSSNYYRLLQDYVAMLGQINLAAHTADAISKIEADTQSKVTTDALTADQSLQQACANASVTKTYTIAPEISASLAPVATTTSTPGP